MRYLCLSRIFFARFLLFFGCVTEFVTATVTAWQFYSILRIFRTQCSWKSTQKIHSNISLIELQKLSVFLEFASFALRHERTSESGRSKRKKYYFDRFLPPYFALHPLSFSLVCFVLFFFLCCFEIHRSRCFLHSLTLFSQIDDTHFIWGGFMYYVCCHSFGTSYFRRWESTFFLLFSFSSWSLLLHGKIHRRCIHFNGKSDEKAKDAIPSEKKVESTATSKNCFSLSKIFYDFFFFVFAGWRSIEIEKDREEKNAYWNEVAVCINVYMGIYIG